MFDEQEKMRTFNVLKNAVEKKDYKIKLENGETLKGDNLTEYFGNLLGISMIKQQKKSKKGREKKGKMGIKQEVSNGKI